MPLIGTKMPNYSFQARFKPIDIELLSPKIET